MNVSNSLPGCSLYSHTDQKADISKTCVNKVKNVTFSSETQIHFYEKVERSYNTNVPMIVREYRRVVDAEAKKVGLTFAAGHDYIDGKYIYPFDEKIAREAVDKM